jgi:transcriptional regulator with XRE-family HTH domain
MEKTENTISLWVLNKVQPSLEDVYKAANLLNVEITDLLKKKNVKKKLTAQRSWKMVKQSSSYWQEVDMYYSKVSTNGR